MGLLLAFMFLWNMVGALLMMPALARLIVVPAAAKRSVRKPGSREAN
jgi:hypothetical protein